MRRGEGLRRAKVPPSRLVNAWIPKFSGGVFRLPHHQRIACGVGHHLRRPARQRSVDRSERARGRESSPRRTHGDLHRPCRGPAERKLAPHGALRAPAVERQRGPRANGPWAHPRASARPAKRSWPTPPVARRTPPTHTARATRLEPRATAASIRASAGRVEVMPASAPAAARPRRASVHDRGWPTPPSASLTAHHR